MGASRVDCCHSNRPSSGSWTNVFFQGRVFSIVSAEAFVLSQQSLLNRCEFMTFLAAEETNKYLTFDLPMMSLLP